MRMPGDEKKADLAQFAQSKLTAALIATGEKDRDAFRQVYRLTSSKLFGVCLRICGSRQAAEDVMQEVYLTIWQRAGGYDPGRSSPITWLATIARNRAIDWRRTKNLAPPDPQSEELTQIVDPAPSADVLVGLDEADRRLHRCLDDLEAPQRQAIHNAFFEGLTYAELADREQVPLGTMKSRVRRGLARLRDCLGDD